MTYEIDEDINISINQERGIAVTSESQRWSTHNVFHNTLCAQVPPILVTAYINLLNRI